MKRREFLRTVGVMSLTVLDGLVWAGYPAAFGDGPIPRRRSQADPGAEWHAIELPCAPAMKAVWDEQADLGRPIFDTIRLWHPRGVRLSKEVIQFVKEELSQGEIRSNIEQVAQRMILRQARERMEGTSCLDQDSDSGAEPRGVISLGDESTGSPIGILRAFSDGQDGPPSAK